MRLSLLAKSIRAYRQGRLGDAAVYKVVAFGAKAYPDIDHKLKELPDPFPAIDLALRRTYPEGSFGQALHAPTECAGLY